MNRWDFRAALPDARDLAAGATDIRSVLLEATSLLPKEHKSLLLPETKNRPRRAGPIGVSCPIRSGARCVEFGIERFGALDDGEFDGDAILEMANDLPAHGAKHDLDADRRLDVDLDRGAGQ